MNVNSLNCKADLRYLADAIVSAPRENALKKIKLLFRMLKGSTSICDLRELPSLPSSFS
jgi:hypothetical protein